MSQITEQNFKNEHEKVYSYWKKLSKKRNIFLNETRFAKRSS